MSAAMLSGFYSVFIFGIVVAFLGSIKLKLAPRIGADDAQFGKIVAALQWTMVVMAILAGLLLDTLGFRVIVIAGALLSALAIFLIGRGKTIGSVIAACLLLGIAGQFVTLPLVREASFIAGARFFGYQGIEIWYAPIPIHNYGEATVNFRQIELTGTSIRGVIKA